MTIINIRSQTKILRKLYLGVRWQIEEYIVYSFMYSLHVNKEYISNTGQIHKEHREISPIAGYNSLLIIVRLQCTISDDFDQFYTFRNPRKIIPFIVFGFTVMLQKLKTRAHISVQTCSNVPRYAEPVCIVYPDLDKPCLSMLNEIGKVQETVQELREKKQKKTKKNMGFDKKSSIKNKRTAQNHVY